MLCNLLDLLNLIFNNLEVKINTREKELIDKYRYSTLITTWTITNDKMYNLS